jgi:hypothetical protein
MNNPMLIENTALEFWALAGWVPDYPCDIKTAMLLTLPLELYPINGLCVQHVLAWAQRVHVRLHISGKDRRLHGCLVASRGKGTICFDALDPDNEQRFTLAHELAHFLLDYHFPRQRALLALGPTILPVLDGERLPRLEERLYATLSMVHLGTMSHFMERPDDGLPAHAILDCEDRADRLALELLAPALLLQAIMRQTNTLCGFQQRLQFLTNQLLTSYGLPAAIAPGYARSILYQLGEPTFRDWLSGDAE